MKKLLKWINPFKTATVNLNDNIKDLRQHNTQRRYFPLTRIIHEKFAKLGVKC